MTESPTPVLIPSGGIPEPIDTPSQLATAIKMFTDEQGPVAIDAERASGYRYSQRAYLVQLRRGATTVLIDPLPFPDLTLLSETIADSEWVLHAATQDLPCLRELNMAPQHLFDTELAGRLAGYPRVNLGALVTELLGFHLEKSHSAVDWSIRPLPSEWLAYAALDVEMLIELRNALEVKLTAQGKYEWAKEEFAALVTAPPPTPRSEPWRRTSGIHTIRTPRGLARVKALWEARDTVAREEDTAPGRVLPDRAIISAAIAHPVDERKLFAIPEFTARAARKLAALWLQALQDAREAPTESLPLLTARTEAPPATYRWAAKDPAAAERLGRCRKVLADMAAELELPAENLLAPDSLRRLAWSPPEEITPDSVAQVLHEYGVRQWQQKLVAEPLAQVL